jgi:hypothetical protein
LNESGNRADSVLARLDLPRTETFRAVDAEAIWQQRESVLKTGALMKIDQLKFLLNDYNVQSAAARFLWQLRGKPGKKLKRSLNMRLWIQAD